MTLHDNRNPNPIVMWGTCTVCGGKVALFKRDEADYLANPVGGLAHFGCLLYGSPTVTAVPSDG